MSNETFDFVVIGGGSAGYNAASTACGLGLKTAVIEGADQLGGLCILRGCMPSKTLIESANRFLSMQRAAEFGLRTGGTPSFHGEEIIERKRRLIAEFADYRAKQLESGRFRFLRGEARFIDPHTIEIGGDTRIAGRTFLIATGSTQKIVDVPGLRETGFIDSDAMLDSARIPDSIVILGGGATAMEAAHYYSALGAKVTVIQRSGQVLKEMDGDVVGALVEALERRGVEIFCHTQLLRVEQAGGAKRVWFQHEGQERAVEAAEILYSLGRVPRVEGLGLEAAGITLGVNHSQQTNHPHIFAAGDVCGPYEIVHIAIQQGEIAARNAARLLGVRPGPLEEIDYRLKLFAVFSHPQVAAVGMSERELQLTGVEYRVAQYPFNDHGKSIVQGETEGFVKLITCAGTGEILGAAVVGPEASELIHEVTVAMAFRATAADLLKIPHYHPTLSEIWTYPAEELA